MPHDVGAHSAAPDLGLEAAVMKKVFWRLMPFFFLCYVVAYLDRVNVSFAALQMNAELGLSPEQYAFGVGIFVLGYVLLEVPSNLALNRFGARFWIARIMITWGALSICMAFIQGPASFYILRVLVGAAEAGFVPGVFLYITYWFPAAYRGRVMSTFLLAVPVSSVFGSVISGFLLDMHGLAGLSGWKWLFILEGLPALALGVVCIFLISSKPQDAGWLRADERAWLIDALARDDAGTGASQHSAWRSAMTWRVAGLCLINVCMLVGFWGMAAWLPQMVKEVVSDNRSIGLLAAVPNLAGGIAMVLVARSSDRRNERTWHTAMSSVVGGVGLALSAAASSPTMGLAALVIAAIGIMAFLGNFWTLPTLLLSRQARVVALALIASVGNLGAMGGPYIMGWLKAHTGSFQSGLMYLSLFLFAGGVLTVLVCGRAERRTVAAGAAEDAA